MEQNRKTTIIVAGLVFAALFMCGVIGFFNDKDGNSTLPEKVEVARPASNAASLELSYCSETARLCIVSFGRDNAENMLITVRNSLSTLPEFFIKIKQAQAEKAYECQKVQFSPDTFYCLGNQLSAETQVTLEIYSKSDGHLAASGSLTIHYEAVAEATSTQAPTSTQPASTATIPVDETPTPAYPNGDSTPTPTKAYP